MWWQSFLWGVWNGITAWILLILHLFGIWQGYPVYDVARSSSWYNFGFLVGAGSPFLGMFGRTGRKTARSTARQATRRAARRAARPHDGPPPPEQPSPIIHL
jgi:hypothetical protein